MKVASIIICAIGLAMLLALAAFSDGRRVGAEQARQEIVAECLGEKRYFVISGNLYHCDYSGPLPDGAKGK